MKEVSPYIIQRTAPYPAAHVSRYDSLLGGQRPDFRNYWRLLRKHARLVGAALLASLLICLGYMVTAMTLYTASSTVMFQPRASEIYNVRSAQEVVPQGPPEAGEHDYYKTRYELLKSRTLAGHVIRDLRLDKDPSFAPGKPSFAAKLWNSVSGSLTEPNGAPASGSRDEAGVDPQLIDTYLGRLTVKPKIGTSLVTVFFTVASPSLSAQIVNTHVRDFIGQEVALRNQASKHAQEYMEQKLSELKRQVEHSEAALNAYRRQRGIVTFSLHEKGQALMQRLNELNVDLAKAESAKIALETQHQLIAKGDYEALPEVVSNTLVQRLKEETTRLAAEYASLSNRFNPGYHPLDDLAARMRESQNRLKLEIRQVALSVEANYRASVADEAELKQEIEEVKNEAMALNDASLQDSILAREVDTSRDLYKDVLERMSHIGVSSDVPGSDISVVDGARPPRWPSSPKIWLDLSVGGGLGLLFGIGLAFVSEAFDDRVKSAAEIEELFNLPTLSTVPDFVSLGRKHHRYVSRSGPTSAPQLSQAHGHPRKYLSEIVTFDRHSVAGEAYRTLRAAVMYSRPGGAPRTVLITSSAPREGKTVTAINGAVAFAQLSGRVLLVDCDLRRPRCHTVFNLDKTVGLADVLVGQAEYQRAVKPTALPNLSVLTAGASVPSPAELLASDQMHQLVQTLKDAYDYVFFDSPPMAPVSDTLALATMVDGVVVVVDANTPKQTIRSTFGRLSQIGAKVLGVVLNRIDIESADYHYHHGHSYHYWYYYHHDGAPECGSDSEADR